MTEVENAPETAQAAPTEAAAEQKTEGAAAAAEPKTEGAVAAEPETEGAVAAEPKTEGAVAAEPKTEGAVAAEPKTEGAVAAEAKTEGRRRKERVGVVVKANNPGSIVVAVSRRVRHPKYKKYVNRRKRYAAHDTRECKVGDQVKIQETRPLSKTKHWRVIEKLA